MRGPTKNLGPIGSAVLAFIGYQQTDMKTDYRMKVCKEKNTAMYQPRYSDFRVKEFSSILYGIKRFHTIFS